MGSYITLKHGIGHRSLSVLFVCVPKNRCIFNWEVVLIVKYIHKDNGKHQYEYFYYYYMHHYLLVEFSILLLIGRIQSWYCSNVHNFSSPEKLTLVIKMDMLLRGWG